MALNRARVYGALREKLFAMSLGWAMTYPNLPDENEVPEQSIAVLIDGQSPNYGVGHKPAWNCQATVIIYALPDTGLDMVDQVEAALEFDPGEAQPYNQFGPGGPSTNLGGLCTNLRMGPVGVDFIRNKSDKRLEILSFEITFTAI